MLTKSKETELQIFGLLTVRDSTITELSETLAITPRTLKEHVRKLNYFAEDLLHIEDLIQADFKGNYVINHAHIANKDTLYGYLKMAAYKTTTKFQIVLALILHFSINKSTLAKQLYVSRARIDTLVNQLNDDLRPWEMQIESENGLLSFVGRELSIRLYSYAVLVDAFQSLKQATTAIDYRSPFHFEFKQYSTPTMFPERFETSAVNHLQKIIDVRLSHGKYLGQPDPVKRDRLRAFFKVLIANYDTSAHIAPFLSGLDDEQRECETMTFNFFSRIIFADSIPLANKQHLVSRLLSQNDHYANIAVNCVAYLQSVNFLEDTNPQSLDRLTYFLTLHLVYFDLLQTSSFILTENKLTIPDFKCHQKSKKMYQLLHYLKVFAEENNVPYPKDPKMAEAVLSLIVDSFQTRTPVKIKIFIQTNLDMAKRALITDFLTMYFNADLLELVDVFHGADLIVTDSIGEFPDQVPVLFIKSTTSPEQWELLTDQVRKILLEKIFTQ